jgi:hypothetical protein
MRNIETAQIIQLFGPRPKPGKTFPVRVIVSAERPAAAYSRHEPATITAENFRLRKERYDDWRQADAVMDYWRAVMKMKSAISRVQNYGTPEGDTHDFVTDETHGMLITKWRAAWARLMLTPAPCSRELNWKRDQIKGSKWQYNGLSAKRIEQAIADDVEWLEAHPTRKGGRKPSISGQEQ